MHLPAPKTTWHRLLAWVTLAVIAAGVVWLYQRPEMLIMLSDQLWACF